MLDPDITRDCHARALFRDAFKYSKNGLFTDISIVANNSAKQGCIMTNRILLASVSRYLKDVFEDLKEEEIVIIMPDLSVHDVEVIMSLIYNGSASFEKKSEVHQLLENISLLHLDGKVREC